VIFQRYGCTATAWHPDGCFTGELVCRSLLDADGAVTGVEIIEADRQIRISDETAYSWIGDGRPGYVEFDGHTLKVHGINRSVIYRIVGRDITHCQHLAEWPD